MIDVMGIKVNSKDNQITIDYSETRQDAPTNLITLKSVDMPAPEFKHALNVLKGAFMCNMAGIQRFDNNFNGINVAQVKKTYSNKGTTYKVVLDSYCNKLRDYAAISIPPVNEADLERDVVNMLEEAFDQAKDYVKGARAQQKLFEEEK